MAKAKKSGALQMPDVEGLGYDAPWCDMDRVDSEFTSKSMRLHETAIPPNRPFILEFGKNSYMSPLDLHFLPDREIMRHDFCKLVGMAISMWTDPVNPIRGNYVWWFPSNPVQKDLEKTLQKLTDDYGLDSDDRDMLLVHRPALCHSDLMFWESTVVDPNKIEHTFRRGDRIERMMAYIITPTPS